LHEDGLAASKVTAESYDQRILDPFADCFSQFLGFIRSAGRYLELSADQRSKSF
jgi:hypothetical protein